MSKCIICLVIVFFLMFGAACHQLKNIAAYSNVPYRFVNYDKVKIEFSNRSSTFSIKGFIRFRIDSFFCFRFWGPLGYEVIDGYFRKGELFTKTRDNISISKASIENTLGLVIDQSFLQNFLLGNDSLLVNNLNKQNPQIIDIARVGAGSNKIIVSVYHKVNKKHVEIIYIKKNGVMQSIKIHVKEDSINISIQILEVSNIDKICNFKF